jgi:hypothetical protein
MKIPLTSVDLIKKLDREFPVRPIRATDYQDKAAEVRMLLYAGKRELIDLLLVSLSDSEESLPILNKKE